jgi:hypothetical protein
MLRSKAKSLSAYERVLPAIEHSLQSALQAVLAIVAIGVIYRYCWIGLSSVTPRSFFSANAAFCRYFGSF